MKFTKNIDVTMNSINLILRLIQKEGLMNP
ncbi:protein of unknown function [Candidatus Nitrosacidococcus tergens]|uniref:Uncharacterized protein n=1 Tax=Candidatus Nitrosacidococcus tergens TaxID=553981 RepID=A0A7G1Q842_9GAMM|nr:protein of unknown function [Candidatus Nitrosacidococcus tergens]